MHVFNKIRYILLLSVLFLTLVSCNQQDLKLVNKVKTFSPKWSSLNDKFTHLDRNLKTAEEHFEKDFKEIEGLLGEIADSLKGRNYRNMLADYKTIITDKDTIRIQYKTNKEVYVQQMNEFNEWEAQVMKGELNYDEGIPTLKQFEKIEKRLTTEADSMGTALEVMFEKHNTILRSLTRMMKIFNNYDIKYQ